MARNRYGEPIEGDLEPPPRQPRIERCAACGGRQWIELTPAQLDQKFPYPSPPEAAQLGDDEAKAAERAAAHDAYLKAWKLAESLRAGFHVRPCATCLPVVKQRLDAGHYSKNHNREECEVCRATTKR